MFFKYLHINSILLLFFCLFIFSCQTSDEKRTKQFFQEWQNKQIIFTDNLTCSFLGKDTMCHELFSKKYKILLYVDSSDCTPCRLQLYEWHKKIEETKNTQIH